MNAVVSLDTPTIHPELLQRRETVVVYFGAPWCGPCRSMTPMLTGIAEEHPEQMLLVKVNVDEHPELLASEGITSVPVVKIHRNGELVHTLLGGVMREDLLNSLDLATE